MSLLNALPASYRPLLRHTAILAGTGFLLALVLIAYLFGVQDHFFSRLFWAFFVFFWLLAVTFLGVVPFVTWASGSWFGKGWVEAPAKPLRRPRTAAPPTARKNTRTTSRLEQK
ncbi:hypothetical protein [Hymenobacter jejuensis]|uniref:Uncharacterized protein n=1 Tax=Hymenobacter jejuensis TaxID=2502781 RepID=A0A5B8A1Z6_9BACT|nr:hypothetical protein [Hymenobacter jejuensis]QDA60693.1 hypothetical protein FHG12_11525 [Hymenobacter jejuensis]